ncbi:hypothetical protein PISMIDRAFT_686578 [Pisolithus microcarpus 441]|uniref:Uncharacterized protein n=1 Tax=Pisolithus microcarpus 441 TaxID=765257 RepID=A0A0C9XUU0_9AGAM|nr:hypothetical protein PISMIDRAFT_686578 [Pisolithus microcarpus 441]
MRPWSNYKEISASSSFPSINHAARAWIKAQAFLYAGANAITAPTSFHTSLQNFNENYLRDSLSGKIDVPAVRVLRLGTFGKFREWKIRTSGGAAVGQMNVPVVVCDEGCRTWLEGRVVCDV